MIYLVFKQFRMQNGYVISQEQSQTSQIQKEETIFFGLMQRVGTMGKYQIVATTLWCIMVYMAGGLTLMTPFLLFQDSYHCDQYPVAKIVSNITAFVPSMQLFKSASNKFGDYRCQPQKSQLTLTITIMYSGALFGIFAMSVLGDILSRKVLLLGNLILVIIGIILTIFSVNLLMVGIGMCLCVFGGKNNFNICLVFTSETVSQGYREIFIVVIQTCYCFGGLTNVLWYFVIGDFQLILIYCYAIPAFILFSFLVFFIKDTPISLVTKKSAQKAFKALKFIAKTNGKQKDLNLSVQDIREIQYNYKRGLNQSKLTNKGESFSILDLFRYKSLRTMVLMLMLMDFTIDLVYYTPVLMLNQFNFSIFINGLVVQSSQIIASIVSSIFVHRSRRRLFGMICFGIVLMASVVLVFMWDQNDQQVKDIGSNILVLAFIFVISFTITAEFNCFLIYINELLPTQVRIIGVGWIKTFGGTSQMLSALIITFCLNTGFKIMILFALLAGASMICSYFLTQTKGTMPVEVIKELKKSVMLDVQI